MILEVRAVPPFYKNGFVVGCERTHEAVVIDPATRPTSCSPPCATAASTSRTSC